MDTLLNSDEKERLASVAEIFSMARPLKVVYGTTFTTGDSESQMICLD
jgi:hypothetical protein